MGFVEVFEPLFEHFEDVFEIDEGPGHYFFVELVARVFGYHCVVLLVKGQTSGVSTDLEDCLFEFLLVLGGVAVVVLEGQQVSGPELERLGVLFEGGLVGREGVGVVDEGDPVDVVEGEVVKEEGECREVFFGRGGFEFFEVVSPEGVLLGVGLGFDLFGEDLEGGGVLAH